MPNRLANATSPYLLQHRDNPVDWWPWCDEAFEEARCRDVPVFLSIGYAACHWCHVMAHESFEDQATADVLNDKFVSIKVDREERPDVDSVYMAAVQGLTGQGGWPMTVFLNHQRQPFHAGTYFPLEPRAGMPSFQQVLIAVSDAWVRKRADVDQAAGQIAQSLAQQQAQLATTTGEVDLESVSQDALIGLARDFDPGSGGFGGAPKFPPSSVLEFLIRYARRTEDLQALAMINQTCEAMAAGGIYDQLAGGFARYSVDRYWFVPHFEKMLYDNAMLLRVYTHWFELTGNPTARRVVAETADFMLRDLETQEGGFASALDADAPVEPGGQAHEGLSYVWTRQQLIEVLGEELAEVAAAWFEVTPDGTFEAGSSVLQLPDLSVALMGSKQFETVKERLLDARNQRPQPARDDKIIAAWNGLAIAALADAATVFDRPDWLAAATRCAELIENVHVISQGDSLALIRSSRDGQPNLATPGVLEDYGDVCEGLLALAAASGDNHWFELVERLLDTVLTEFTDGRGRFYDTSGTGEQLIVRPSDPTDLASPSGWSAVANALIKFGTVTADETKLRAGEKALEILNTLGRKAPRFAGWLLATGEGVVAGPWEAVVVGDPEDPAVTDLRNLIRAAQPTATVVWGRPDDKGPFRDRPMLAGKATAYVCRGSVCFAPVTTREDLLRLLASG